MEDGLLYHAELEEHVALHGAIPKEYPQIPLKNPQAEQKVIVSFNDMFDLSCKYDILDVEGKSFIEFKTGVTDALEYASGYQIPLYFLIGHINAIKLDSGYIIHHNQYENKNDWCIVHNSPSMRKKAINLIESVGPEIYQFFEKEGFL